MKKKLLAVAVAGALAAPAVVMAQASTVQIYGKLNYEYGIAHQGDAAVGLGRPNTDYADTPGGSAIGFKGEEKLGGGLSAWFQCESSADVRGLDQTGFCTRNSAVGFKGAFGSLHFGRWDTPFKRALNQGSVGAEETGLLGMSFVTFGGSGGADASGSGNGVGLNGESQQRGRWKRRETGLTYYESPKFNGFQVLGAFSHGNAAVDGINGGAAATDATINPKPRIWSLGGMYNSGPVSIGFGYEKHVEMNAVAGSGDDRGWGLAGSYDFGKVTVGLAWIDTRYETAPGRDLTKKNWMVGVEWNISGPHGLEAAYARAGDSGGNSLVAVQRNDVSGPDTGAKDYSIAYTYQFSKRTRIKLGYHKTDNDANTLKYNLGNTAATGVKGESENAFAFHISHRF